MTRLQLSMSRVCLVLAAYLTVSACTVSTQSSLEQARAAIAANDTAAAIIHLRSVLASEPTNGEAKLLLGQQMIAAGDPVAGVIDLRRALELKVPTDRVVPEIADALLLQGLERQLIDQYSTARLSAPAAVARLNSTLARAHLNLGSIEAARRLVELVLRDEPNSVPARLAKAEIARSQEGVPAAMKEVDALLASNPTADEAWSLKGSLLELNTADLDQALEAYAKALAINPRQIRALYSTVAIHLLRSDLVKAASALEQLKKNWPQSLYAAYMQARLNHLQGKYADARIQLASLLNLQPEAVPVLLAAGINELKLAAPIQAEALLARAVSLAPDNVAARYYLAQANLQLGRPERASQSIAPLLEASTAPPEVLVIAAQARLLQGDASGSESLYLRAAKFDSKDPSLRTALALARAARGETEIALRELQKITEGSDFVDAHLRLVGARLANGDADGALAAIDVLQRKQPELAAGYELRGQALLLKGDRAAARKAFEEALQRDKGYVPALGQLGSLDLREGQVDRAKKRIADALAAQPNNTGLMTLLAEIGLKSSAPSQEVLDLLERATKADPRDLKAWLMLIMRHFHAGDMQAALNVGRAANTAVPDNVQLLDLIGRTQLKVGDIGQANSTYANVQRVAPRSPAGYIGQAAALLAAGNADGAAKVLQRMLEMEPNSVDVLRLAADVAMRRKQPKEALRYARQVQRLQPTASVGYAVEGGIETRQGNWGPAAIALRKGIAQADGGSLVPQLHAVLLRDGKAGEAERMAQTWIEQHPKDTTLIAHLGDVALADKEWPAARKRYEQALAIDPNHFGSLNNLAWLMIQTRDPGAVAIAQKAAALRPQDTNVLDTLGLAYAADKRFPEAIDALKRAINRASDPNPLRLSLAKVYLQAEDRINASAELERLIALGKASPQYAEARKLMAETRRR